MTKHHPHCSAAPDNVGGAYSAPLDPQLYLKGPTSRGSEGTRRGHYHSIFGAAFYIGYCPNCGVGAGAAIVQHPVHMVSPPVMAVQMSCCEVLTKAVQINRPKGVKPCSWIVGSKWETETLAT